MQIAILAVLILIAVLIAPWILGVIAALVALYGIYVVSFFIIGSIVFLVAIIYLAIKEFNRPEKIVEIIGERKACRHCSCEMPADSKYCYSCGEEN